MREIGYLKVAPAQAKDPDEFIKLLREISSLGFTYVGYIPMGAKGGVLFVERYPGVSSSASMVNL